jgi:hypothetical protein
MSSVSLSFQSHLIKLPLVPSDVIEIEGKRMNEIFVKSKMKNRCSLITVK